MYRQGIADFPYYLGIRSLADVARPTDRVCVLNILGGESRQVTPTSHAFSGGNVVFAGDGNDWIESGDGDDYIAAGAGDDYVDAGGGANQVLLQAGDDIAVAGSGNDLILGGSGRDLIVGGGGEDRLLGGQDDDLLVSGLWIESDTEGTLRAIHRVWTDPELNYHDRVDAIMSSIDSDDGLVNIAESIANDADADSLVGGNGQDWAWADPDNDQWMLALREILTELT